MKDKAVYTIVDAKNRKMRLRIGTATENKDKSLNVTLDALPINGMLHIRDRLPSAEKPEIGKVNFGNLQLRLMRGVYRNAPDKTAVFLEDADGETFELLSINVPGMVLEPGEFVVNHDVDVFSDLFQAAVATGTIEDTWKKVAYGCVLYAPVWRVK